jgi:hypothetical protein
MRKESSKRDMLKASGGMILTGRWSVACGALPDVKVVVHAISGSLGVREEWRTRDGLL